MSASNYFPAVNDSPEVQAQKLARARLASLGLHGQAVLEVGEAGVTLDFTSYLSSNPEAVAVVENSSSVPVTVSLDFVDPVTLETGTVSRLISPGVRLEGYFTALGASRVDAVDGQITINFLGKTTAPKAVPALSNPVGFVVVDELERSIANIRFNIRTIAGDAPPTQVELYNSVLEVSEVATVENYQGELTVVYPAVNIPHDTNYLYQARYVYPDTSVGLYSEAVEFNNLCEGYALLVSVSDDPGGPPPPEG